MSLEDITYLRDHHVPVLFNDLVRHLLDHKPHNVTRSLRKYLKYQSLPGSAGPPPVVHPEHSRSDSALFDRELSCWSQSWGSGQSTRMLMSQKQSDSGENRLRNREISATEMNSLIVEDKHVCFKSQNDVRQITDVFTKKERGELWQEGEEPPIVGDSGECYLCCYEPNDFEYLSFRLYQTQDQRDWYLICPNCAPKPQWNFCYVMGDTLARCPSHVITNIVSYLPWKVRWGLCSVCRDFQSACWTYFHVEGLADMKVLGSLLTGELLGEFARSIQLHCPSLGGGSTSLLIASLSQQLKYNDMIEVFDISNCTLRSGQVMVLVHALQNSAGSGALREVIVGPGNDFPCTLETLRPMARVLHNAMGVDEQRIILRSSKVDPMVVTTERTEEIIRVIESEYPGVKIML